MSKLVATYHGKISGYCLCQTCKQINKHTERRCTRCHKTLHLRNYQSIQISWALLLTAIILLVLANIYPITILTQQGIITHETIFSGIIRLVHADLMPIAIIVFMASILVPWLKIIGLTIYLIAINFNLPLSKPKLMLGFHFIEFIGRWSMLDLFVISITVSLVSMGQILDAEPAPAATAFALVILLTQYAARILDTRLLWDQLETQDDTN